MTDTWRVERCIIIIIISCSNFEWKSVCSKHGGGYGDSGRVYIIIIIIAMTMFMVLSSRPKVIARVHPVHLMNVD